MKKIFYYAFSVLIISILSICILGFNENSQAASVDGKMPKVDTYLLGNVNGDGKVNAVVAREVLRKSVNLGNNINTYEKEILADANLDGGITSGDARIILRTAVGLDPKIKIHLAQGSLDTSKFFVSNKLYQEKRDDFGDKCLGLAYLFIEKNEEISMTTDIVKNHITNANTGNSSYKMDFTLRKNFSKLTEALKEIYNEIKAGRPVVLQVTAGEPNANGVYSRHFVPVIGYINTPNENNLKETDFVYYDVYDGKIKKLGVDRNAIISSKTTYGVSNGGNDCYMLFTLK